MAGFKVERVLNWGTAYSPEMQSGGARPAPRWDTLREQVREAEELGYERWSESKPSTTHF